MTLLPYLGCIKFCSVYVVLQIPCYGLKHSTMHKLCKSYLSSLMPAVAPRNMGVLPWFEVGTTFITLFRHCCSEGPANCGCCSYDDIPPPENTEVKGSSVY